jgi:hypothetical protein
MLEPDLPADRSDALDDPARTVADDSIKNSSVVLAIMDPCGFAKIKSGFTDAFPHLTHIGALALRL